jgi:protocatechuate 3,4-dioxygenase beta subunit
MSRGKPSWLRVVAYAFAICVALLILLSPLFKRTLTPAATFVVERAAGRQPLVLQAPHRDGELAGTVTTGGAPRAGARVCATCTSCDVTGNTDQLCTETNASGQYTLRSIGTNGYTVTAQAAGFAIAAANDGRPLYVDPGTRRANVDIELAAGAGHNVAGQVLDALGGVIANASVRIVSWEAVPVSTAVTSDAEGRFFASVRGNHLTAIANADGYAPARAYRVAPTTDLTLVLTPESVISGHVFTADEPRAVAGALVVAQGLNQGAGHRGTVVSNEDGSFRIRGLDPGRYILNATAPGYLSELETEVEVGLGGSLRDLEVFLSRAAQVRGRVLIEGTGDAEPCERGVVTLGFPGPATSLRDPSKWTEAALRALPPPPMSVVAVISRGGHVNFDAVLPGTYFASVDCDDHLQHSGPELVEVGSEDVEGLAWRVVPATRVSVRVQDDRSEGMAGVHVTFTWPTGRITTLESGADGWTPPLTHLYPGVYEASVASGFRAEPIALDVQRGAAEVRGVLRLHGDASLEVTVEDHHGKPLDDVRVFARVCPSDPAPESREAPAMQPIAREEFAAAARGLGRFSIAPIPAGCYTVDVRDALQPARAAVPTTPARLQVGEGQHVVHRAVLDRAASIEGRVVAHDGSPLQDVWISAEVAGGSVNRSAVAMLRNAMYAANRVLSDHEGHFRVVGLDRAKSYDLTVEADNGVSTRKRGLTPGTDVTITMPAAAAIEGTVTDARGKAVEAFTLEVVEAETQRAARRHFANDAGRFALSGLTPGTVEVRAESTSGRIAQLTTKLQAGQHLTEVRLSVPDDVEPPEGAL